MPSRTARFVRTLLAAFALAFAVAAPFALPQLATPLVAIAGQNHGNGGG